jgi:predicted NUDIX family NTP pyrophosphohydrolase
MYRTQGDHLELLIVHPGGPFWAKKDAGAWFIPKGEIEAEEDELLAAKREFQEETSISVSDQHFIDLGEVKHKSGKVVHAWAFEGDCDPGAIKSNMFTMEWPPKSGKQESFPEVDKAAFVDIARVRLQLYPAEFELVERLAKALGVEIPPPEAAPGEAQPSLF